MKTQLHSIADKAEQGTTRYKGRFLSPSRVQTLRRVADLTPEIPPGPGSTRALQALLASWQGMFAASTVRTYADALRMVKGDYRFPSIDLGYTPAEPQHLPLWVAEQIITQDAPTWVTQRHLWTICRLAINSCLRPGDAVSVSKNNIVGDTMILKHQKTGKLVRSRLHPALAADISEMGSVLPQAWYSLRLDYRKRILNVFVKELMHEFGIYETEILDTSSGEVQKLILGAVVTAHSLRSTGANYLLSKGVAAHNVMAIGGWALNSPVFIRHYLKPNIDIWKI